MMFWNWLLFKLGLTNHLHEMGKWEPYGITYQRRECKICGRHQIKDSL